MHVPVLAALEQRVSMELQGGTRVTHSCVPAALACVRFRFMMRSRRSAVLNSKGLWSQPA